MKVGVDGRKLPGAPGRGAVERLRQAHEIGKGRASHPERDRLRRAEHELFPPPFRTERRADRH